MQPTTQPAGQLRAVASAPSTAGQAADVEDPAAAAQPAGGGWGGGWGLGGLTSAMRQVASNVTKDVTELTTSFQAALAEVDDSDSGDEQGAGKQQTQQGPQRGPSPWPPASTSTRGRPPPGAAAANMQARGDPDADAARRRALANLEGRESELQSSIKAFDKHVDQLTSNALQKVSGLWGGAQGMFRAAAQSVTETVEEGVRDVSSLHAVKTASGGLAAVAGNTRRVGARLASEAETRLEAIGRQAGEFLEAPRGAVWGAAARVMGPGGGREAPGFEAAFAAHGGGQTFEELEDVCNTAARRVNACRRRLDEQNRKAFEAALVELPPALDMATAATPKASDRSAALDRGHAPLTTLCKSAKEKAEELTAAARLAASEHEAEPMPPDRVTEDAARDPVAAQAVAASDPRTAAKQHLANILAAGSEQLGEITSLCVERVLALAQSVGAFARFRRPSDDGIKWPGTPQAIACMLCTQAKRMEEDLLTVASAFSTALHNAVGAFGGIVEADELPYDTATAALEKDAATAAAKLQEALRGLMYVVLLTSVDPDILVS